MASVKEIDWSEPEPGKVWEPGEHDGCSEQEIYHFHVIKPSQSFSKVHLPKKMEERDQLKDESS